MIEYNGSFGSGDNYNILCDICSNYESLEEIPTFKELIEEMKNNGWKSNKIGDTWIHKCPVCSEKEEDS